MVDLTQRWVTFGLVRRMSDRRRRDATRFAGFSDAEAERFLRGDILAGTDAQILRLAVALGVIEQRLVAQVRRAVPAPEPPPRRRGPYVPIAERRPSRPNPDRIDGPPQPVVTHVPDVVAEPQRLLGDIVRAAADQGIAAADLAGRARVDPVLFEALLGSADPRPAARLPLGDAAALAGAVGLRLALQPWPVEGRIAAGSERRVIVHPDDPAFEAGVDEAEARREALRKPEDPGEPIPF